MEHMMKLNPSPFRKIKEKEKTIELRLYDEKRKQIQVGDIIKFVNTNDINDVIKVNVVELYIFKDFEELYERLPLLKCGYTKEEVNNARASDMLRYYSVEQQQLYGVVGIEISLRSKTYS